MKKLMFAVGISLITAGSAMAACMGPFCWDENGAYINGLLSDGKGTGLMSFTLAQMNAQAPTAVGQIIFVSDATQHKLCVSTGTAAGAYVSVASTGVFVGGSNDHCR